MAYAKANGRRDPTGCCSGRRLQDQHGMTLIELLVAVFIMSILIVSVVPKTRASIQSANTSAAQTVAKTLQLALARYATDQGDYPTAAQLASYTGLAATLAGYLPLGGTVSPTGWSFVSYTHSPVAGAMQGSYTLVIADANPGSSSKQITITAGSITTGSNPVMSNFQLSPSSGTFQSGTAFNLTVQATGSDGSPFAAYRGAIHFTSSDGSATLPADYTFTAADNGVHVFAVTLSTTGVQWVMATDKANPGYTGTAGSLNITAAAPAMQSIQLSPAYGAPLSGTSFTLTVTAIGAGGTTYAGYRGSVHFTSSDASAALPADYTFTATDGGTHTFPVTLKTNGLQSLTVTDTVNGGYTVTGLYYVYSSGGGSD